MSHVDCTCPLPHYGVRGPPRCYVHPHGERVTSARENTLTYAGRCLVRTGGDRTGTEQKIGGKRKTRVPLQASENPIARRERRLEGGRCKGLTGGQHSAETEQEQKCKTRVLWALESEALEFARYKWPRGQSRHMTDKGDRESRSPRTTRIGDSCSRAPFLEPAGFETRWNRVVRVTSAHRQEEGNTIVV